MNERAIKSCLQTSRERERERGQTNGETVLTYATRKGQFHGVRVYILDGLEVERKALSFL